MKKKLISILMILILCFPSASALAASNVVDLETGLTTDMLSTYYVTTGNDDELERFASYEITIPSDTKQVVLPITFDQKGIFVSASKLSADLQSSSISLYQEIYTEPECINEIRYSSYDQIAAIPQSGTYYMKFYLYDFSGAVPAEGYKIYLVSQFYSGEEKELVNKEWACAGNIDTNQPMYFKVNVTKTGSLTINTEAEYSTKITLLNSSKKAISEEVYVYSGEGKAVFAVAKGTYYIKVTGYSDFLRIKATMGSAKELGGTTKAKATKMTAGKTYVGYLTATEKKGKTEWYKITLTKSQKVNITFTGSVSSGDIKLEFFGGGINGSINRTISTVDANQSFSAETWTSSKLPKGTYYIKVYKADATTSGFYKLSLEK